jgi:hypothetical protein
MKKSQLRNIIREVITEGHLPYPNHHTPTITHWHSWIIIYPPNFFISSQACSPQPYYPNGKVIAGLCTCGASNCCPFTHESAFHQTTVDFYNQVGSPSVGAMVNIDSTSSYSMNGQLCLKYLGELSYTTSGFLNPWAAGGGGYSVFGPGSVLSINYNGTYSDCTTCYSPPSSSTYRIDAGGCLECQPPNQNHPACIHNDPTCSGLDPTQGGTIPSPPTPPTPPPPPTPQLPSKSNSDWEGEMGDMPDDEISRMQDLANIR